MKRSSSPTAIRPLPKFVSHISTALILGIVALMMLTNSATTASLTSADSKKVITMQAAGRGRPWINLTDGQELRAAYTGEARSQALMKQGQAIPTALASADFDKDGVPDLIGGYVGSEGGVITLQRGNPTPDTSPSSSAQSAEHKKAGEPGIRDEAPLLAEAHALNLPQSPDFMGAGDFNADGHKDIVAAARGSNLLTWMPGNGSGGFGEVGVIALPGAVTALTVGEINRADGLEDVAVATTGNYGPQVHIFESPAGAFSGAPEVWDMPAEVTALAIGQLDSSYEYDLAIAAGYELAILHGRDRHSPLDDSDQAENANPALERIGLGFAINSIAVGDFLWDREHKSELALLSESGEVHLLERGRLDKRPWTDADIEALKLSLRDRESVDRRASKKARRRLARAKAPDADVWAMAESVSIPQPAPEESAARLNAIAGNRHPVGMIATRTSSLPVDTFVVMDGRSNKLHMVVDEGSKEWRQKDDSAAQLRFEPLVVTLDTASAPVAVLPMRLNRDPLTDLVILQAGSSTPTMALTAAGITIIVTNISGGGASICPGVACKLRDAIELANNTPGMDNIGFDIGTGTPTITPMESGVLPIIPAELPEITESVFINGNTGGATRIEINGENTNNGLFITGGLVSLNRLVINRNAQSGIVLAVNGGNDILDCHIGTDSSANTDLGNGDHGVLILSTSPNNTIRGTDISFPTTSAIAGNDLDGVSIGSSGNQVFGVTLGTDGLIDLGNSRSGVTLLGGATLNRIGKESSEENLISGNGGSGVLIQDSGTMGNLVLNNIIGLSLALDNPALPNNEGVTIVAGASNNTIGGSSSAARNFISGSISDGVRIQDSGTTGNEVEGNFIGTNLQGTVARANGNNGVEILAGATNNTIGGSQSTGQRNVISGNGLNGVAISGSGTTGNRVFGNFIGTTASGGGDLGNTGSGVVITNGAASNFIGDSANPLTRNVISGNNNRGVMISGANGNEVGSNIIGLNSAGTSALGNTTGGVIISGGAANNKIGASEGVGVGVTPNIISGNGSHGVLIEGSGTNGNQVLKNFIGTDAGGTLDRGNAGVGVLIEAGASNNTIGGGPSSRNIISGNSAGGVRISDTTSNGNAVLGNYIGTNANGDASLGNSGDGVSIFFGATNATIGDGTLNRGNVISGNGGNGVVIAQTGSPGTIVKGNIIGLNAAGNAALGNTGSGVVLVLGASNVLVGGTTTTERNVISGNNAHGLVISDNGTVANRVVGNRIGIGADILGNTAIGNTSHGVHITNGAAGNTIGGTGTESNVISANGITGVSIEGSGTTGNLVQGNFIGTNASGTGALGNIDGIVISNGASNNTIGGTSASARNVISGNTGDGVEISDNGTTGNLVQGNLIGTNAGGTVALGNSNFGIEFRDFASNNTIGGASPGAGNTIAFNGLDGVIVPSTSVGNAIRRNSIHSNTRLGIELNPAGVNPNDPGDGDGGANNGQNFPLITSLTRVDDDTVRLSGTLNSTSSQLFRIDVFVNNSCDPSGHGEGEEFLLEFTATTDSSGNVNFSQDVPFDGRGVYTLTATNNSTNDTSEFSPCAQTLVVNTLTDTDDGVCDEEHCSLREAINAANNLPNSGEPDTINFDLPGGFGPTTIDITSSLPHITDAVVIDGLSQPGATCSAPRVQLLGTDAGLGVDCLVIEANASGSTIRGLVINRFGGNAILIDGADDNVVQCNFIGPDPAGTLALGNGGSGVFLRSGASNNTIGGTGLDSTRNIISDNSGSGVRIFDSGTTNNVVVGNYIGTDITGTSDMGNGSFGVWIASGASNNRVGGTELSATRNVISGNSASGIELASSGTNGNLVQGNFIGTTASGTGPIPNGNFGIQIDFDASNNSVSGNTIAFNDLDGVFINASTGISLRTNNIHSNGGLGIDLAPDGVNPNDPGDTDGGANNRQNFPVISSIVPLDADTVTITGTLNSTPNLNHRIEVYTNTSCDPSGHGEGEVFTTAFSAITDSSGNVSFSQQVPFVAARPFYTLTASADLVNDETSEFSRCAQVCTGVVCPDDITASTGPDSNQCGATVTFSLPDAACGEVTCSPPSGSVFPVGTTTVTCTAEVGSPCEFTVTVNDTTPPQITCPSDQSLSADSNCEAVATYSASATDNCDTSITPVCMPASGSTFPIGTTTVTCTATDAAGNSAQCSFTVTVTDDSEPTLNCPAPITVNNAAGQCSVEVDFAATASDNCDTSITPVCTPASGSTFSVGTTTVTCEATDAAGNSSQCNFTVTVTDRDAPEINCPAPITQGNDKGQCSAVVNFTATASDNCDPSVTPACTPPSGSVFPIGATTVNCAATDAAGNTANCSFTVTVHDVENPAITCPDDITVTGTVGQPTVVVNYTTPSVGAGTVSDNCAIASVVCNPPSGSAFPLGTTTVTCTATDTSGNTAQCSFTVSAFDVCIEDDSNPGNSLLFISTGPNKGDYRICCGGQTITGRGTVSLKNGVLNLTHFTTTRRVQGYLFMNQQRGSASLQSPPTAFPCVISDSNTSNNSCSCAAP